MGPTSPLNPGALAHLHQACRNGALHLVDAEARPLSLLAAFDQRCWAHLRDADDGRVYVHEIPGSRVLTHPRYLEMLGIPV